MNICGIYKNGIDEAICKAEIETQMQRTNVWTPRGTWGGCDELEDWTDMYILLCAKRVTKENLLDSTGRSAQRSV